MSSSLYVRDARKDEIPVTADLTTRAFRGRPLSEALFPGCPGGADEVQWRLGRYLQKFGQENYHYIVVVDEAEKVVGQAIWMSAQDAGPPKELTPEEREAENASLPKSLDLGVLQTVKTATKELEKYLRDALGEEEYNNSWYLDAIAVDPDHQRKGIGKMLMEWGHERAAKQEKNIRLIGTASGAKMYRALGYEEVGALEVLGGVEGAFIKKRA